MRWRINGGGKDCIYFSACHGFFLVDVSSRHLVIFNNSSVHWRKWEEDERHSNEDPPVYKEWSEYKVLVNKTVLCFPLGGKQSSKTASISSFPGRRTPHDPLRDGVYFPLLCIWAGFVTSFARNSVSTHVQFWSSFEKNSFLLTFHSAGNFSSLKFVALLGLRKCILQLSCGPSLSLFFIGRLFLVHSAWEVVMVCVQGPVESHANLRDIFL